MSQTSNHDDDSKPINAVDDNNDTCAVTAASNNPYWQGTFSDEVTVTYVTLFNVGAGKYLDFEFDTCMV